MHGPAAHGVGVGGLALAGGLGGGEERARARMQSGVRRAGDIGGDVFLARGSVGGEIVGHGAEGG